jgi:ankyrin repeat protein
VPNTITKTKVSNDRSSSQSLNPIYDELLDACLIDDLDSVRNILDKNPELIKHTYVSMRGSGGNSLLHVAAAGPSPIVVEELLERGIDVNLKNDLGFRPLEYAICGRSKYFYEPYGETVSASPRVNKVLELLLEKGAEISEPQNKEKRTALHLAVDGFYSVNGPYHVARTDFKTVSILLDYGANPNAVDIYGETPLHRNCYPALIDINLQIKVLDLLIYKGADINIKNNSDKTPALCASGTDYILWNLIKYCYPFSYDLVKDLHLAKYLPDSIRVEIKYAEQPHRYLNPLTTTPLLHFIGSESVTQPLMKAFLYLCKTQAVSTKLVRTFLDIAFRKEDGDEIGYRSNDNFINIHKTILKNIAAEYNKAIDSRNEAIIDFVNDIKRTWESDKDREVRVINLNIKEDYEYAINYADIKCGLRLYEDVGAKITFCENIYNSTNEIFIYINELLAQKSDFD